MKNPEITAEGVLWCMRIRALSAQRSKNIQCTTLMRQRLPVVDLLETVQSGEGVTAKGEKTCNDQVMNCYAIPLFLRLPL